MPSPVSRLLTATVVGSSWCVCDVERVVGDAGAEHVEHVGKRDHEPGQRQEDHHRVRHLVADPLDHVQQLLHHPAGLLLLPSSLGHAAASLPLHRRPGPASGPGRASLGPSAAHDVPPASQPGQTTAGSADASTVLRRAPARVGRGATLQVRAIKRGGPPAARARSEGPEDRHEEDRHHEEPEHAAAARASSSRRSGSRPAPSPSGSPAWRPASGTRPPRPRSTLISTGRGEMPMLGGRGHRDRDDDERRRHVADQLAEDRRSARRGPASSAYGPASPTSADQPVGQQLGGAASASSRSRAASWRRPG